MNNDDYFYYPTSYAERGFETFGVGGFRTFGGRCTAYPFGTRQFRGEQNCEVWNDFA